MQPEIVQLPELKVVGLGARFISILAPDKNNMAVIPALWDRFFGQIGQIASKKGETCYGLVEELPKDAGGVQEGEMFYIACAEVSGFEAMPAGMIRRTIPAGRYAKFTHRGRLDGLEQTMRNIYRVWVPESKTQLRDGPHIERYDERFDPGSEKSEFDIFLPVR